ncbi:MAG: enoyl-CoA hydratase/isomerase family protein [Desulfobacterales bacterium]
MDQIRAEVRGSIGIIILINPPHNYMTSTMVRELDRITLEWASNPAIRSIIITGGVEGIFITHYSIEEIFNGFKLFRNTPDIFRKSSIIFSLVLARLIRLLHHIPILGKAMDQILMLTPIYGLVQLECTHRVFNRLQSMDKVVIAAINGETMGGGCELALSCDFRLMADGDFRIGLIEALGGIIPGAGGTQRLPRLLGNARALEMMLDGKVLTPVEAERIGLVNQVVEKDQLMEEATALAKRLAARPRWSVRGVKRAVYSGSTGSFYKGLETEKAGFMATGFTEDASAAFEYYLEQSARGKSARQIFDSLRERNPVKFQGK